MLGHERTLGGFFLLEFVINYSNYHFSILALLGNIFHVPHPALVFSRENPTLLACSRLAGSCLHVSKTTYQKTKEV